MNSRDVEASQGEWFGWEGKVMVRPFNQDFVKLGRSQPANLINGSYSSFFVIECVLDCKLLAAHQTQGILKK